MRFGLTHLCFSLTRSLFIDHFGAHEKRVYAQDMRTELSNVWKKPSSVRGYLQMNWRHFARNQKDLPVQRTTAYPPVSFEELKATSVFITFKLVYNYSCRKKNRVLKVPVPFYQFKNWLVPDARKRLSPRVRSNLGKLWNTQIVSRTFLWIYPYDYQTFAFSEMVTNSQGAAGQLPSFEDFFSRYQHRSPAPSVSPATAESD